MVAYWKTHRLKGHEKLIFVGYFSFKIEVLTDFKFTKNKDLTQKRAVWAGAWDKTLTIIPQSYRGTFDKRTHRMYRIFSHTCDKFSTVFSDNYPFHRVIRHKAVAGGGKTYSRKLFSRLFLITLITYTISRPLHDQWPRLHEIKNRKGSKFQDNRPVVVPFSSRVIGKLHASFIENAERDLGRVANPKDNRNELWCSLHCPPPRPCQKLQVTATRRIVTIRPGLLKAGWR